jgi:hypothetical protein
MSSYSAKHRRQHNRAVLDIACTHNERHSPVRARRRNSVRLSRARTPALPVGFAHAPPFMPGRRSAQDFRRSVGLRTVRRKLWTSPLANGMSESSPKLRRLPGSAGPSAVSMGIPCSSWGMTSAASPNWLLR